MLVFSERAVVPCPLSPQMTLAEVTAELVKVETENRFMLVYQIHLIRNSDIHVLEPQWKYGQLSSHHMGHGEWERCRCVYYSYQQPAVDVYNQSGGVSEEIQTSKT